MQSVALPLGHAASVLWVGLGGVRPGASPGAWRRGPTWAPRSLCRGETEKYRPPGGRVKVRWVAPLRFLARAVSVGTLWRSSGTRDVRRRRTRVMAKRRRIGKLHWRSKKANHGRKPCRGKDKRLR